MKKKGRFKSFLKNFSLLSAVSFFCFVILPAGRGPEKSASFVSLPSSEEETSSGILSVPTVQSLKERFLYYYQTDPQWADYLYGGNDPMSEFGCGPTAMAMVVSNLTSEIITPPEMAEWAFHNGYYSRGHGSFHALIPEAAKAFGLRVESLSVKTPEALRMCLENDKIAVFLMGPGHFTDGGHFILIIGNNDDGTVRIADPVDQTHSDTDWDPALLLSELSSATDSGSPAWVISRKD